MNGAAYIAPEAVSQIQRRSLIVGMLGLALCLAGAFANRDQFFRSYLTGYLFYAGVTLGCLAMLMLHHLTGGAWGLVIRRVLESATRTLPLLALLFIPVLVGIRSLYVWAGPELLKDSDLLQSKESYLNASFFAIRGILYFLIWMVLAYLLNRWSAEQDQSADPRLARRLQGLSGPGLVLYGFTVSFAAIDWVMSLEPQWVSTIYGMLFIGGQGLSAMSFTIAVAMLLARRQPMSEVFTPSHFRDLGKLLLMFVMVWAYLAFSQFLLIWAGDLPEEIAWYLRRWQGGWQWVGIALIVFHFAVPFLLLLSRELKRQMRWLSAVAALVIVMRFVDLFWLIAPEFHAGQFYIHWMDFVIPIGLGGVWLAFFLQQLKARPLLPLNDPCLASVLHQAAE